MVCGVTVQKEGWKPVQRAVGGVASEPRVEGTVLAFSFAL